MRITIRKTDQNFTAELAWAVWQDTGYRYLVAASYCALPTAARAIFAALVSGQGPWLELDDGSCVYLSGRRNEYSRIEAQVGDLVHVVVLPRSCLFREDHPAPMVLAPDGDLARAVGRYLSARYGLPAVWGDRYFGLLHCTEWQTLAARAGKHYPQFRDIAAVRLSTEVTEQRVLSLVGEALRKGRLKLPRSPVKGEYRPGMSLKGYLQANAPVPAEKLASVRPRHVPGEDAVEPCLADLKRVPFPAQAHMITALVKALEEQKTAFCSGDMGTGETLVALGTAWALARKRGGNFRVLVAAPPITVPKWRAEMEAAVPGARVWTVGSTEEALAIVRDFRSRPPRGLEFVVVSTDRAKLGPEPWCAAVWKRVAGAKYRAWHCPDCGRVLKKKTSDRGREVEIELSWQDLARGDPPPELAGRRSAQGFPQGFAPEWRRDPALYSYPRVRGQALPPGPEVPRRGQEPAPLVRLPRPAPGAL